MPGATPGKPPIESAFSALVRVRRLGRTSSLTHASVETGYAASVPVNLCPDLFRESRLAPDAIQ